MMDMIQGQVSELKRLWKNKRQLGHQILNLGMIVFSALMMWKGLMCLTLCEAPVVVVLRCVPTKSVFLKTKLDSLFVQ